MTTGLQDIYNGIVNQLQNSKELIKWVDLDLGQIDRDAKVIPLEFPAVLLKFEDIIWWDKIKDYQIGLVNVSVKTVFKFTNEADNYTAIKIRDEASQFLKVLEYLHDSIGKVRGQTFSRLLRYNQYQLKSKPEFYHWIQVMEYQCNVQSNGGIDDPENVYIDYDQIRNNNTYMERRKYNLIHK